MKMRNILICCLGLALLASCGGAGNAVRKARNIDELVWNAGKINTSVSEKKVKKNDEILKNVEENGRKWNVRQTRWFLEKNMDKNIIPFNPNANTLWPGSLVQGNEVASGVLNSIGDNIARAPITITVKSGDKLFGSAEVNEPSNPAYSRALSAILKGAKGNTAANMTFRYESAFSTDQACLQLGISPKWLIGSGFSGNFEAESNSRRKTVFIFFKQEYYTVSVNEPAKPSDYFAGPAEISMLAGKVSDGNPLCYVASVTYGRLLMVKMTYTGKETAAEVAAAVNGAFGGMVNIKGKIKTNSIVDNSTFEGVALGGSAGGAARALTGKSVESILKFINEEANYSADSPGYPIAYTVKNLADNSIVKLGESTEYTVKEYSESEDNYRNFNIRLEGLRVLNDCEPYGAGDFYYNIDIVDQDNQSLIGGAVKIPSGQSVSASDGEWIGFKGQNDFNIKLPNFSGSYFRVVGKVVEKNVLVQNIELDIDRKFNWPWPAKELDNGWKHNGSGGYYGLEMSRDGKCRLALIMKVGGR